MQVEFTNLIRAVCDDDVHAITKATNDIFDANYLTHGDCMEGHQEAKKDLQDIKAGLIEAGLTEEADSFRRTLDGQMDIRLDSGGYNKRY
jgi:hypothetical protein